MQAQQSGIFLSEVREAAAVPACPFLPPQRWDWEGQELYGHAEWFQLRPGLDYIYAECRLNGPSQCRIDLAGAYLVIGYVTRGWAKWATPDGAVEKIEAGQWFTMPRRAFAIDRTDADGVAMGLCICSQAMARQLSELCPPGEVGAQLQHWVASEVQLELAGGPMGVSTFALARQVAAHESSGLKRRLQIESNTLAWIAELLSQGEPVLEQTASALNADDRDAVERLCQQMRAEPGYEYSLDELCQISSLNEHKLKSAFKLLYGKTTFGYLRELRMDHAAHLLKEDRFSVIQVANEVGYSNASHFARAFKMRHGLLPKAYQCLHRKR
ncbi:AraC family transcriptional regulator [Coraliomargarita sp. SDUM461004]|uniref:AraC family transcriptional regulator n=1 Tax=Thalassobacterium sedimentorum TaxID=3041258 RepID=A0ABU1AM81_9BACT|nr:AraC family transcriptional regulator [Coraliomargarita sp. SDUM461004]MDQ8194965.1 AraC family transcriptional regulator [Coraliomargarita sp. SDUM461004]